MKTLDSYIAGARFREQQRQEKLHQKWQRGGAIAEACVNLLKGEFGCTQVMLFGSMQNASEIDERSDIDLLVWGLLGDRYLRALGKLLAIAAPEFQVDLVRIEEAPDWLLEIAASEKDGKFL
ncbi:MAG: nucleotidyltransferase domain-containing protein [Leptolyngbyaceae bacterium]|nr:nucleotidyltransferase domain-containing protein [Leptolyngbyaceae bacterium]